MDLRLTIRLITFVLLWLCPAERIFAQNTVTGALTGTVTDPSGAVVPGADVSIRDLSKGTTRFTKTNLEGSYQFSFLSPSRYSLRVRRSGFREMSCELEVLVGPPATRNVQLQIEGGSATIKVTGEVPLLQAENGDAVSTINTLQVSQVPNPGNDLTYIAQTAPGAIMNTDTLGGLGSLGNVSILGMPATSNLFTLNGMNNNNALWNTSNAGALGMTLGQNEIEEASVVSNGYSAQFGGAAGSNINFVTKSGGNAFHGNAAWYWNGSALNANDWIDNAYQNPKPFDIANQWAGSLGGPIIRDKFFFFFDTEGMRLILPSPTYVILPSAAFEIATMNNIDSIFGPMSASHAFYQQMFSLYNSTPGASAALPGNFNPNDLTGCNGWQYPNGAGALGAPLSCAVHFFENLYHPASESIVAGRVDWNIDADDRAFLLLQYDHGQRAVYLDPVSSVFNAYLNVPWWAGQLSETHTFSSASTNQFLFAASYISALTAVANPAKAHALFPTTLNWGAANDAFSPLGGEDFQYGLSNGNDTTSFQITDDFVQTRGRHQFSVGVSLHRTYSSGSGYSYSGTGLISPQTMNAFFYGGSDSSNKGVDFTTYYQNFPLTTWNQVAFYYFGLYGQDEWHALPNLTFTVALRADHSSNPVCEDRCFARLAEPFNVLDRDPNIPYSEAIADNLRQVFFSIRNILWSPRFSFAWQPFGTTHSSVIRGGVGIFYDPTPGVVGSTFAANPPNVNSFIISGYNLAPAEVNSLYDNALASNTAFVDGYNSGQTLADIQRNDANFTPPAIQTLPKTTFSPQYQKWSLQLQQGFAGSTSLTVGYFGNHGIHELFSDLNQNARDFGPYPTQACGNPPIEPCYDSRFGAVYLYGSSGISNYNGLVVSFEKRINKWGSGLLQVNYTYGHALDEISNGGLGQFAFGSSLFPQDGNNLQGSYGPADYDVRHSLNANYIWGIPVQSALRGHGPDWLTKGWQVSGTVFARTGFPYTVIDAAENGALAGDNVLNPIYSVPVAPSVSTGPCGKGAAVPVSAVPCLPPQFGNDGPNPGALFVQSGCETGFNEGHLGASGVCNGPLVSFAQGRNRFRGPGYVNTDFAIMKETSIPKWETGIFTIGFQFFNLFNHANFGLPDAWSSDSTFGQIFYEEQAPTSLLGSGLNANVSGRMIQAKVEFRF